MTRLFLSLYFGLVATLFVFVLIADYIGTSLVIDIENALDAEKFTAEVELLEKLEKFISVKELNQQIEQVAQRNQIIITEIKKSNILPETQIILKDKKVSFQDDEYSYFRAFEPAKYFQIASDDNSKLAIVNDYISSITFLVLVVIIALCCFLWLFSLNRKLVHLESVTLDLSLGNLAARASTKKRFQVGDLNHRFNEMATRIQQLLSSHKELTHAIAHELHSPLFRMHIQLELLESIGNDKSQQYISGLTEDVYQLEDLINELLSYAKMERAELALAPENIQLSHFVKNVCYGLSLENETLIELNNNTPTELEIYADKKLLDRALANLLKNAIKYGNKKIIFNIFQENNNLCFTVEDDGDGIPDENKEDIFKPFYRLDKARSSQISGHGLGLSISKEIAELHNATLSVENSLLGGALFRFCLSI